MRRYEELRAAGMAGKEAYATVSAECTRTVNVVRRQQCIMAQQVCGKMTETNGGGGGIFMLPKYVNGITYTA